MNKEYLKSLIDCVSGIEVKSEAEQIAKYELIEYVEDLQQTINKLEEWLEYLKRKHHYIHNINPSKKTIIVDRVLNKLQELKRGVDDE